jgi:glycosyltransferase involved in cell wall biosynthesis
MNSLEKPLISVVTPVYNGEDFWAECIESVLSQTYQNLEYIIVNNCSTDRTLSIAMEYAKKDPRIRIHTNKDFVGVMENHNIALSLISREARYCKVVCADDFIFPECLARMVELAEANPAVSLVGSYSMIGKKVMNQGLEYERKVVSGREICHATLAGGPYVFGSPTTLLYRADLVRKAKNFYPNSSPHCDTTACYQALEDSDFGFVHQVLSYTRIHAASQTSRSLKFGTIHVAILGDVARFGPKYLSPTELKQRLSYLQKNYYSALVPILFTHPRNRKFWRQQRSDLQEIGLKFSPATLLKAVFRKGLRLMFNPSLARQRFSEIRERGEKIEGQYYHQAS